MALADESRIELDKVESNIDQVVVRLKEIEEQLEEAIGTTVLLGLQDSTNRDAVSLSQVLQAAKTHASVVLDLAFSSRQLVWAYRPKL